MTETGEESTTARQVLASPPPPTVWHSLSYRDGQAAIDFLVKAFGFVATAVHADEQDPSQIMHAELRWPAGGGVMLGSSGRPDGMADPTGHASAYVVVDGPDSDVDALFERAVAAGATVVREPRDEDYGNRDFVVRDPEGNQWSFGTYRGQ